MGFICPGRCGGEVCKLFAHHGFWTEMTQFDALGDVVLQHFFFSYSQVC